MSSVLINSNASRPVPRANTGSKLLDMLAIEGAIVTIDAMGCPRDIAQKVVA